MKVMSLEKTVARGDIAAIDSILKKSHHDNLHSALFYAVEYGMPQTVKHLHQSGAHIDFYPSLCLLSRAADLKHYQVFQYLFDQRNTVKYNYKKALLTAIKQNFLAATETLLSNIVFDQQFLIDEALFEASKRGLAGIVKTILNALPEIEDGYCDAIMGWASNEKHYHVVYQLRLHKSFQKLPILDSRRYEAYKTEEMRLLINASPLVHYYHDIEHIMPAILNSQLLIELLCCLPDIPTEVVSIVYSKFVDVTTGHNSSLSLAYVTKDDRNAITAQGSLAAKEFLAILRKNQIDPRSITPFKH